LVYGYLRRLGAGAESAEDRVESEDPPADLVAARAERETGLRRALAGLEAGLLEAIDLHYYRGLSLKETAAVLGVPTGTAKSRMNRALGVLRDLLDKEATHAGPKADQATANGA
jgi:RNA polymerase sigma factor (sigma-70 family)